MIFIFVGQKITLKRLYKYSFVRHLFFINKEVLQQIVIGHCQ